ncbi:hypothetical protein Leryth_005802 [Lithospermum erythrorhizon]|nr:hypothetical protein Leryth_005802 [Lithospermum erythrorhizon]
MGKNDHHNEQKQKKQNQEELLQTLGDFTSKDNWDTFFTIRSSSDAFEWYAEWEDLKSPLLPHLNSLDGGSQILVPGCGNSRLSEYLYDEGFKGITNIDFSKVAITGMLRKNVRVRKEMKWRVMDMTHMQLDDESFDAVVDKGGLDALMEPGHGPKLGNQYLSEVKRVLKVGGKFICLTLGESHVLALLLPKFRYGWKMSIHAIPQKTSNGSSLQTLMVIAEKDNSAMLCPISSSMLQSFVDSNGSQAMGVSKALDTENDIRSKHSSYSDIIYTLEDLKIGAKGKLEELSPGRRVQLTLGELVASSVYRAVLLDAPQDSGPFIYDFGAFLVPKVRFS